MSNMARIIYKGSQLEDEYLKYLKYSQNSKQGTKIFLLTFIISMICVSAFFIFRSYLFLIAGGIIFIIGTILSCVIGLVNDVVNIDQQSIIASGIQGEKFAEMQLSSLPDDYVIFRNMKISFDNRISEIDNIIVGKSGVFVVEIKNNNGNIFGDYSDKEWIHNKIGRGGTPYSKSFYNPVKQVGTHVYRLSHYLKDNNIRTYVNGIVYFANPRTNVTVSGEPNNIPVFSYNTNQGQDMIEYILNGKENLSNESIHKIIHLLNAE